MLITSCDPLRAKPTIDGQNLLRIPYPITNDQIGKSPVAVRVVP
jgi:hypothetical protein